MLHHLTLRPFESTPNLTQVVVLPDVQKHFLEIHFAVTLISHVHLQSRFSRDVDATRLALLLIVSLQHTSEELNRSVFHQQLTTLIDLHQTYKKGHQFVVRFDNLPEMIRFSCVQNLKSVVQKVIHLKVSFFF